MKALKSIGLAAISLVGLVVIIVFEIKEWPVGNSIAGIVLGFSLPGLYHSVQDLFDNTSWKSMQRKYERAGVIKKDTVLRISFAYLYRITIADKYLLVKNARGTGKYQPVGGVYKLSEQEKLKIKNRYQVKDDNKVLIDESSRDDYRLRIENKYLRGFVRRFNKKADREKIDNLSRESSSKNWSILGLLTGIASRIAIVEGTQHRLITASIFSATNYYWQTWLSCFPPQNRKRI